MKSSFDGAVETPFPKLMKSALSGNIWLFTAVKAGDKRYAVCIGLGKNPNKRNIGDTSYFEADGDFSDYNSPVTIQN